MTTQLPSAHPPDALDELVDNLLDCGGALSQMISHMVRSEAAAAGRATPETAPIPEIAHGLIRSVAKPVAHSYSKRDIKVAAKIVAQMTEVICDEIFMVDPDWIEGVLGEEEDG
jgi:hypothetical protein